MYSMSITTSLLLLVASTVVSSVPAPLLDAKTILSNGQAAQRLNALFQTLNSSDPCSNGDKACVGGAISLCGNGKWDTTSGRCATSQNCFAVPDIHKTGTILSCTSEASAISAIEATGATGGILGDTNTSSTTGSSAGSANSTLVSTMNSPPATSAQPSTVTVTLTAQVTTLPPETRTLSPQEAFRVLASLVADGGTIINSHTATTSVTAVVTPTLDNQPAEATLSDATPTTDMPSESHSSVMATPSASLPNGY